MQSACNLSFLYAVSRNANTAFDQQKLLELL